ncbi:hypothetical protein LSH36_1010g00040, partial [Paralvinella palmiformis]
SDLIDYQQIITFRLLTSVNNVGLIFLKNRIYSISNMSDLVAVWEVSLSDGLHLVEFEHGTTTGKRVIRVDGKVMVGHRAPSDAHP